MTSKKREISSNDINSEDKISKKQALQQEIPTRQFLIRAFFGPEKCVHNLAFKTVLGQYLSKGWNIQLEKKTLKELRESQWSATEFFDWILNSDLHFILCHLHQSVEFWSILDIKTGYERLSTHSGFPTGRQTRCPVINQDKFDYLSSIKSFCNPTMQIMLPFEWTQMQSLGIQNFLYEVDEGKGWVVKSPYVTNTKVAFCSTAEKVLAAIETASEKSARSLSQNPYTMIQPTMSNRKEYRVVCLGMEPLYVARINAFKVGRSFSQEPHMELFEFVRQAIRTFKTALADSFAESLFRVDVFQRADGRFVVNEFENLEACFDSTSANELTVVEHV